MARLRIILVPLGLLLTLIGGVTYGILYSSGWAAAVPLIAGIALVTVSATLNIRGARTEGAWRSARAGMNAVISIIALAAILVFLQTLAARHNAHFDFTSNKRFSLSPQTQKILRGLGKELSFTCFFKENAPEKTELEDLLMEYAGVNRRVTYAFIDPDRDPVAARRYKIKNYGTIVLESGGAEEQLSGFSEEKLTNAIARVTREGKKVVYVVTGHGEKSIDETRADGLSEIKRAIESEGYAIKNLLTLRDSIPSDCSMLILPGPENDIYPPERIMIERYLSDGGALLALVDPLIDLPHIEGLIAGFGIELTKTIVVDRFGKMLAGNYLTPIVNEYGKHPITESFRLASFFPQARGMIVKKGALQGVQAHLLASTGASAYAETAIADVLKGKTQYDSETDAAGPIGVAAVATKEGSPRAGAEDTVAPARHGRLVVFGDSDFASNAHLGLSGNKDLIMNTIGWLAEQEDLIAVRPKNPLNQPVVLNAQEGRVVFWLPVIALPAVVLALGLLVALNRRRAA